MDAGLASIDLSAAYDMVSRKSLFKKLYLLGISGNSLEIIQDYCANDSVIYGVGTGVTKALYLMQEVKQGCNLSPLLFNLFLVDIIEAIHKKKVRHKSRTKHSNNQIICWWLDTFGGTHRGYERYHRFSERTMCKPWYFNKMVLQTPCAQTYPPSWNPSLSEKLSENFCEWSNDR